MTRRVLVGADADLVTVVDIDGVQPPRDSGARERLSDGVAPDRAIGQALGSCAERVHRRQHLLRVAEELVARRRERDVAG
jgi:hypothetical protein